MISELPVNAKRPDSGNKNTTSRVAVNAFTVDVEDYFQVEAFATVIDRTAWERQPARVAASTERVLDLLDRRNVKGTFFVLGWVAERFPTTVQKIAARGHEVASHGYGHRRVNQLSPEEFRRDVRRTKNLLEDCTGSPVRGYRAPTFSVGPSDKWPYEILNEEGHRYSSSVYPIAHDLYGDCSAPRSPFCPLADSDFLEIPIGTVRFMGANRPCGGGGYFRLLPYRLNRWFINRVNSIERRSCVFYCHPWEFDTEQPYMSEAPIKSRFRHYVNIGKMERRVEALLRDFPWGRMDTIFLGRG